MDRHWLKGILNPSVDELFYYPLNSSHRLYRGHHLLHLSLSFLGENIHPNLFVLTTKSSFSCSRIPLLSPKIYSEYRFLIDYVASLGVILASYLICLAKLPRVFYEPFSLSPLLQGMIDWTQACCSMSVPVLHWSCESTF